LTYNQADFIEQTIRSVLAQKTTFPFAVLVHDDASTDGTQSILFKLQQQHPELICLMIQDSNILSNGRSPFVAAMRYVNSQFIAICEGDDFWIDSKKLQIQFDFMQIHPDVSLTHHDFEILNENGFSNYEYELMQYLLTTPRSTRILDGYHLAKGNFILTCTTLIRTNSVSLDLLEKAEGFSPYDWIIFAQVAGNSKIGFINKKMATYRLHKGNFWANSEAEHRQKEFERTLWLMAGILDGSIQNQLKMSLSNCNLKHPSNDELEMLSKRCLELQYEVDCQKVELNKFEERIRLIENSKSWRYTQSLRLLKNLLKNSNRFGGLK
jgi:glycosyltransferase involved in cell wall biosynthesis